ncbi:competence type IV pilus ATPase ComGA [Bacillus solimangrovi]|uniref:AAA+ ATPase domain-containing protein n=1 Tax=Bacillus solimangrovi TaxID=1305675 RepID=A0A1E5LFM7_9BACI|nr:competence type IV pilus ATPase ComGA [Bacillus solimangrovi]OEH92887.1 hypothetical protein BFG57_14515 [Bacillus solimangrovi]
MIASLSASLIESAILSSASDIHFTPSPQQTFVSFRIAGKLQKHRQLPNELAEKLIAQYKFLSGMDIGECRRPQSSAYMTMVRNEKVFLRFSTLPTVNNQEGLVIRVIPQHQSYSMGNLTVFRNDRHKLLRLLQKSNGLFLITGPTGSGKTTTLYSLLQVALEQQHCEILTLEDPVERYCEQFTQIQINEKAGLSYEEGIIAALRYDPDILVIGEIRNTLTAKMAIRAAYTGHLVISTLHTKRASDALFRLRELGIPAIDMEQTLIGIAAQQLVNLKCKHCLKNCSYSCNSEQNVNRTAIFEILTEEELSHAVRGIDSGQTGEPICSFFKQLRKAFALGYIAKGAIESSGFMEK